MDKATLDWTRDEVGNRQRDRNGSCRHLFVYGTLRRAVMHPMHATLSRAAEFAGAAMLPGRLYDLGEYPGVTNPVDPNDWVVGISQAP